LGIAWKEMLFFWVFVEIMVNTIFTHYTEVFSKVLPNFKKKALQIIHLQGFEN